MIVVEKIIKTNGDVEIYYGDETIQYFANIEKMQNYADRSDPKEPNKHAACVDILTNDPDLSDTDSIQNVQFSTVETVNRVQL